MVIEVSDGVTVNLEQVAAVIRSKDGKGIILVSGQRIKTSMKYEDISTRMKNLSIIKTTAAY